jgi:hypothetical protein
MTVDTKRLRALDEEATPGPWRFTENGTAAADTLGNDPGAVLHMQRNAKLAVEMRNAHHELLDAYEERSQLKALLHRAIIQMCECQGRGYRSWENGKVVKPCSNTVCIEARTVLGLNR